MALDLGDLKAMWLDLRLRIDQLGSEREQYLDFFERSPEAYVVTDAQGTIVAANGAATDILQRRKRYLQGKPFAALVALERRAEFRSRLRRLAAGEPGPALGWRTIVEAPELRTEVTLMARAIERPQGVGGICWLLQAAQ